MKGHRYSGPGGKCSAPDCNQVLSRYAAHNARYCSATCRNRMRQRRMSERKRSAAALTPIHAVVQAATGSTEVTEDVVSSFLAHRSPELAGRTRGVAYRAVMADPQLLTDLMTGKVDYMTAAELLGYHSTTMSRVMEQIAYEFRTSAAAAVWSLADRAAHLLGLDIDINLDLTAVRSIDPETVEDLTQQLAQRFVEWRAEVCTDEKGKPYTTKPFHQDWIAALLHAAYTGGRVMILSPPRHGKTQLLIDFCIWLILRHPNIRILWIASNTDLAGDWVASIEDQLENNERLRSLYLPPGGEFRAPTRGGKSWSRKQFTVATRTVSGVKSPTMQAIGRGGRILSRDVDFMVVDDIEDDASTATPGALADTRKWFALTAGSRKEEHTGVALIGSRQDPEDLHGHLIDNVEWKVIVQEAHSSACLIDPFDEAAHIDCMLFPEKNSYAWLQSQRRSMSLEGGDELFEMVYLNRAVPRGMMVFDEQAMRARIDGKRRCGEFPAGSMLVAGLDPAVVGHQSGFLWAYHQEQRQMHMVDLVVDTGPGIAGFLSLLREWTQQYPTLTEWVVEQNAFQRGYLIDPEVRVFASSHHLHIQGHETQQNKWDDRIGLGAMARLFTQTVSYLNTTSGVTETVPAVTLPGLGRETADKVDVYIRQAKYFSSAAARGSRRSLGAKSDVLMASWFPMKVIRRWGNEWEASLELQYDQSWQGFSTTEWNEVPW